jgi:hypothetical protein
MADLRIGAPRSRRLIIFVLGPVSYNEVRAAHELSASLGREVLVVRSLTHTSLRARGLTLPFRVTQGGTSVVAPEEFLGKLKSLRSTGGGAGGGDDDEEEF